MNDVQAAAAVGLCMIAGVLTACGSSPQPSGATLRQIQAAVDRDDDALARKGIFVATTGRGPDCAEISLLNPTRENVEYIRKRYGPNACVRAEPGELAFACAGEGHEAKPGNHVVPSVVGQDVQQAAQTLKDAGYRYAAYCPGQASVKPQRSTKTGIERFARVTRQCPAAGTRTATGEIVGIEAVAVLPGGYRHTIGQNVCD